MTRRIILGLILLLAAVSAGIFVLRGNEAPRRMTIPTGQPVQIADNSDQQIQGAAAFEKRCKPCHGDVGQGLALWRLTWAPEDQNCTQSKCHSLNHPPDGFYMPKDAPAIIGPGTLNAFPSALELNAFIRKTMPFDKPGELSADEYWAVTAYLLKQNGFLHEGAIVDATNANSILLK